jgi:serine/threonine protein kinase
MDKLRWQQIEDLYNSALEQPAEQRNDFVSRGAGDDNELRMEVLSLLESADTEDSFLAQPGYDLGLQILAAPDHVLSPGQTFGNYEVLELIGRGGMGEVYLAKDTRLGRKIALKVLPRDVAADHERIKRFVQEARAASALNHPNILTIHEIGEENGWQFIGSEYVEGPTLREALKDEKPLPPQQAIDIATQIATALTAAHEVGIVHRDIKPENIMLRRDGLVKVLDFGLAKLTETSTGPKATTDLVSTTPGMVMGTIAYMSPEQTRGKDVDARTDLWSLGVVIYEMITGHLPFGGETSSDMIAAILTRQPDLPEQGISGEPGSLWRVVAKCLQKDIDKRYGSASELTTDLRLVKAYDLSPLQLDNRTAQVYRQAVDTGSRIRPTAEAFREQETEAIAKPRQFRMNKLAAVAASIAVLLLGGGYFAFRSINLSGFFVREPMKIDAVIDSGKTIGGALSPDGKMVAHVENDAGQTSLWIKHIASNSDVQLIPPSRQAWFSSVTFSKDGSFIYYIKNETDISGPLYRIPVLGGDSRKIFDRIDSAYSFSPDGSKFAYVKVASDKERVLTIVDTETGTEHPLLTRQEPENFGDSGAVWSPDGRTIATSVWQPDGKSMSIELVPAGGGEPVVMPKSWTFVSELKWLPDGSALVGELRDGNVDHQLWLLPLSGEPRRITTDLNRYAGISLSSDGSRLLTGQWQRLSAIWRVPGGRSEEARVVTNNIHANYQFIALAPDGRIVFPAGENVNDVRDIMIMSPDGTGQKPLTFNAGNNTLPCVTSDGRYIVFTSNRGGGKHHVWRMNIDGNDPVQLTNGPIGERQPRCGPDPKVVYYVLGGPDAGQEPSRIMKTTIDGGEPIQLTDYPSMGADVSPDGQYLAFRFWTDTNAPPQLRIMSVNGDKPDKTFDVKIPDMWVRWRPDGKSVTFVRGGEGVSNIWEQPIEGGPPRPVTKFTAEQIKGFDWTRDGDLICSRNRDVRDAVLISHFN